ncbi:uncharacterized protein LOC127961437 [Carassius gibelio]|uniref:uncharacterized protein LOC127961437 n=1 Tax=Carassius gibelio TaxID=101364 RepID=UPI002277AF95|nr:uncharacterized protein LOC127961437 [Carassius gibelio]
MGFLNRLNKKKTTVHSDALLSTTEGTPIRLNLHCVCLQTHSEPPIPAEKILSLSLIPAGPHCKNEQIIATMKEGWLCLDPSDDWVISLEKEVYKRKTTVLPEALLYTTEGTPIFLNLLCECSQTYSEPPIPVEKILSLRVIPAGPQCKNEQIIATMEEEQMCLDPTKDWVISLITELINESTNVQPVTSNWIQKEVVHSTASFTRETGETFCVM